MSTAVFLPKVSAIRPQTSGARTLPNEYRQPIKDMSLAVIGVPKGFMLVSFDWNWGITGDVHTLQVPSTKHVREAEKKHENIIILIRK